MNISNGDHKGWSEMKLNKRWISKEEKEISRKFYLKGEIDFSDPSTYEKEYAQMKDKVIDAETDIVNISKTYALKFGDFSLLKQCKDLGMI